MDFLVYSRAVPASERRTDGDGRPLNERHWSYMDGFADGLTARGPTLGPGRDTWTGSLHIVDLPDADAVRAFVDDEPYQQAGLFTEHSVWRFGNLLGRTMWDAPRSGDPAFLVLALEPAQDRPPVPLDATPESWRESLVVYGALGTLDGEPAGLALAIRIRSREVLDALLADPGLELSAYRRVEVHDWEFGGRR